MTWANGFISGMIIGPLAFWFGLETFGYIHHYVAFVCIW